jgi:DNA-binding transcriptional ArsR family regulator
MVKGIKIYEYIDEGFNVEFIYSPYFEMICSLHVLVKPEHHLSRLNWARDMKENMDKRLYEEILFFGTQYFQWCTAMDFYSFAEGVNDLNVIACLDIIGEIDIVEFIYIILDRGIDKLEIARSLGKGCYTGKDHKLSQGQIELFKDAEGFRRRLTACLKEYYYLYFERELRFIEPLLIRKLKKASAICQDAGIKNYVKSVHPRIEVTDKAFLLHKYTLFTLPFDSLNNIEFLISSFADPHLLVGLDKESLVQFTIMVNLEKAVEEVPFDLFITMKALGDETRLKILRCIYRKIDSTQAIAKEVNISEAGVSKHLKIMQEAGLLFKKRDGNYIRYVIEREIIDRIPMNIYQYLDG